MQKTERVPRAIGVIIDGNRRWAKEQGMTSLEGHRIGFDKIKDLMSWANEVGVEQVTVYAFSTENWNRSEDEVSYLLKLAEHQVEKGLQQVIDNEVRIRIIGQQSRLPESLQRKIDSIVERTKDNTKGTLVIALSYGGRPEILAAVNALLAGEKDQVTEEEFSDALWSAGLLDPDLIIRTGGEQRLSNFLPWQSVYSELFFTETKWPAFTKEEFASILEEFAARERRHGK